MEEIDKNQKVNVAINGFIADFIIKLNNFKSSDEAIKFTENTINEVRKRNVSKYNDFILRDLDFIICDLKGKPYSIVDNKEVEDYYILLRKSIPKI